MAVGTVDCVELFQQSYARAIEAGRQRFFDAFYEEFLSRSADVRLKFRHTNLNRQAEMLERSFKILVDFSIDHKATEHLTRLAMIHGKSQHDIGGGLYDQWMSSLLATVRDNDPEYDDDVELAWKVVFAPGIAFMRHYYDR